MLEKPLFSKVSSKGQIVIPSLLRDKMNIQQGTILYFQPLSNNTFVVRILNEGKTVLNSFPKNGSIKVQSVGLRKTF